MHASGPPTQGNRPSVTSSEKTGPGQARTILALALPCLAVIAAFSVWVWSNREGFRALGSRLVVIERKLLPRLERWQSEHETPGRRVAFFGDSLSMGDGPTRGRRRGSGVPQLLARDLAAGGVETILLPLAHMAFRPIHLYYLLDDVVAGAPDLVVIELNLRVFSPALKYEGIEKFEPLSRRLSLRPQLANQDVLDEEQVSPLDPTLYRLKERSDLLYVWEGMRLRGQEWMEDATQWLAHVIGIRDRPRPMLETTQTAIAEYRVDPSEHPMATVCRRILEELREAGVPVLFYVSPVDVERLESLGVGQGLDLATRIEALRTTIGATRAEWLDLHDRLPGSEFRDDQNHLRPEGLRRVATMLAASSPLLSASSAAETRASVQPAEDRPNIVLLIGDDHGFPYFGFMGSDIVQTPNLDTLARAGTVFPMMHNTASLCAPSLNTLLTGFYPVQWKKRVAALRAAGRSS